MTIKQYAQKAYPTAVKAFDILSGRELKRLEQKREQLSFDIACALIEADQAIESSKRTIAYSDRVGAEARALHARAA